MAPEASEDFEQDGPAARRWIIVSNVVVAEPGVHEVYVAARCNDLGLHEFRAQPTWEAGEEAADVEARGLDAIVVCLFNLTLELAGRPQTGPFALHCQATREIGGEAGMGAKVTVLGEWEQGLESHEFELSRAWERGRAAAVVKAEGVAEISLCLTNLVAELQARAIAIRRQ